jgi:hypothetical protein
MSTLREVLEARANSGYGVITHTELRTILDEHPEPDPVRLLAAIDAILALHQPVDALMYGSKNVHKVQVCTGCGQDDGNWNRYPCPTVRAINTALANR